MPISALERAPLLTRVLVTVAVLLAAFSLVVGTVSAVAVAATKAVFPPADAEPLASGTAAGEAEEPPVPGASAQAPKKGARTSGKVSSKTTAKRAKGDSTE